MFQKILSAFENLPDIWGEGSLFGYSGIDGKSKAKFVATYGSNRYGFVFNGPEGNSIRRCLDIDVSGRGQVRIATGDVLAVQANRGDLLITFCEWHTVIGQIPENARVNLSSESGRPSVRKGDFLISEETGKGNVYALIEKERSFCLSFAESIDRACLRARAGMNRNLLDEVSKRLAFYKKLPALDSPHRDRLLKKCVSVIRVNTLSSEGTIRQAWTTPDRVPHTGMWLWDTVFHSFALNKLHPELSLETLKSVLDVQEKDGMIPHMSWIDGSRSHHTQPPILAWGIWENFQVLRDRSILARTLPILERYLEWNLAKRDKNSNGLMEWLIEGNAGCRSGESGMDNSPRFNRAELLDAVDFSTFMALDMKYVALIAGELGESEKAESWQGRSQKMSHKIHEYLWNAEEGFYLDRQMDGRFSNIKAVSGFFPLLLDDIPSENVRRLIDILMDPKLFNTAFPVPSISITDPAWCADMWRGPTWINANYIIILGFRKHGEYDTAEWIEEKTIGFVNKYYESQGVVFEFYDAKDLIPPFNCDRKGSHTKPNNARSKMDCIRDYHWTAALTACLLLNQS